VTVEGQQRILQEPPGRPALLAARAQHRPDALVPLPPVKRAGALRDLPAGGQVRRSITAVRTACSAALFVGSTPARNKNRKTDSPCLTSRRANLRDSEASPSAQLAANRNTRSLIRNIAVPNRSLGTLSRKCHKWKEPPTHYPHP